MVVGGYEMQIGKAKTDGTCYGARELSIPRMEVARFELLGLQHYIAIACKFNNTTLSLAHARPMIRPLAAQQQV